MLTYYKCSDYLTAFTSSESKVEVCLCGGKVDTMGVVHGARYKRLEELTPCDDRCTNAQGPRCDCQCGGEHHGTGRLVSVCVAEGKVKVTSLRNADKAMTQATEFRDAYAQAENRLRARYGETLERIRRREFVPDKSLYFEAVNSERSLRHLKSMRVHKSRMQAAHAFLTERDTV